jgi:hypothetical protein
MTKFYQVRDVLEQERRCADISYLHHFRSLKGIIRRTLDVIGKSVLQTHTVSERCRSDTSRLAVLWNSANRGNLDFYQADTDRSGGSAVTSALPCGHQINTRGFSVQTAMRPHRYPV